MIKRLVFPAVFCLALISMGCAGKGKSPANAGISPATASVILPPGVVFLFPVANGLLPGKQSLMPGAPRDYRGGIHQGIDVYYKSDTGIITCGEPVLNSAQGWVIRADSDWKEMSEREYNLDTERLKKELDETLLDRLRGRQVWIRTADGITVRYCHLNSVAPGIIPGIRVSPGVVIGQVGNTGTGDGARVTGRNCHLHLEVWMPGGKFLGQGLSDRETRELWSTLFGFTIQTK